MLEMKQQFSDIYARNTWKFGSGVGSLVKHNKGYIKFLQQFLKTHNIGSVVDFGCGDWQFSRYIDWGMLSYQGFDIVDSVIDNNQAHYATNRIQFRVFSGNADDLPNADLLIIKDVLQHWSTDAIQKFLPALNRYKYGLLTNCVDLHGQTINRDINDSEFRPLDLRLPPFGLDAEPVFSYTDYRPFPMCYLRKKKWKKLVLLHRNT